MISIARDVNKPVEEVNTIPMLGFIIDIVLVEIALPDPISISVKLIIFSFHSNFYIFFHSDHYQLK